jgi:catechol-2,3-dioxygenase
MMNTDVTIHPKLQHYGLTTPNLDKMIDWYRKVLGMTINHRSDRTDGAPFSAVAFLSNDEVHHRVVFFEVPGAAADPEKRRHGVMRHTAFAYATLDDLLGTYVRLKRLEIAPVWAVDHGASIAFYYEDPDGNTVELNVSNYADEWTATEHLKTSPPVMADVDPDKMVAARNAGASPWELNERASAGDFAPAKPFRPQG